jgi:hypothetical protein
MKKPSLNMHSIQDLFFQHVEKLVLVMAALVFVALAVGAVKRDKLSWTPDTLEQEANQAIEHVKTNPPPKEIADTSKVPQVNVGGAKNRIDSALYATTPWLPRLWDELQKRDQPTLFPLEGLRASTGYGSVRMQGGPEGKRWVVLTGLLPVMKQREAYREKFAEAVQKRPSTDEGPVYMFYRIERSVEDPRGASVEPNWQPVNAGNSLVMTKQFAGTAREMVASHFIPRVVVPPYAVAFPLPPVENRTFGPEVAHPPEIPVFDPSQKAPTTVALAAQPAAPQHSPLPPLPPGAMPNLNLRPEGEEGEEESASEEEPSGEEEENASSQALASDQVQYQLFRYFDFDVQPGKQYRYRVQLVLFNPNYKIEPRFLAREDLGREQYLLTDWCEPSRPVVVPPDARVFAGAVRPSLAPAGEPTGKLLCVQFEPQTGIEASGEFSVSRGQVADFLNQDKKIVVGKEPAPIVAPPPVAPPPTGPASKYKKPEPPKPPPKKPPEKINFLTEMLVLDMRGGGKLAGKDRTLTEPGFMLLMDASGNLLVRHEILDQDNYVALKPPEVKKTQEKGEPSEEGEEAPPEEEMSDEAFGDEN